MDIDKSNKLLNQIEQDVNSIKQTLSEILQENKLTTNKLTDKICKLKFEYCSDLEQKIFKENPDLNRYIIKSEINVNNRIDIVWLQNIVKNDFIVGIESVDFNHVEILN